ncbi:MAG: (2,3-dihydroxybenzoyl)adenylate synthase [Actinomycetes bacterium]
MATAVSEGTVPWPTEYIERYVAAGYWEGRSLGEQLWTSADRRPDAVALVDGDVRMTYAELTARADAAATRLAELGIGAGERLVVQLPNGWEFVVLTLACLRSGVLPVMALPAHRRHELAYLVEHAEAVAVAVPDELRGFDHQDLARDLASDVACLRHVLVAGDDVRGGNHDLRALCAPPADPQPDRQRWDAAAPDSRDVAVFLLSGGTTGLPKLIARTHDDYAYNAKRSGEVCGFDASTVYLGTLPVGHNFPLACPGILGTFLVGGRVVMLPSPEPVKAFAAIERERVTHAAVVPAVAQRWMDHQQAEPSAALRSLRVLQVGGARLADEVGRRLPLVLGCRLQQVFGMAEGLLNYTRLDEDDEVAATTQGRPMCPDDEVLLVDELDEPVPPGESGTLLTRGPYTPRGYYRAPEQNARAFTADGWYRSGDICHWDVASGNLVVDGRDKDMINRGGEKISAEEVENLLYRMPQVAQVAAVAMPDPQLGERVCVYVVPRAGCAVALDDLRASMQAAGVAAYKLPDRVVVVQELATTKVGKIDKKALRADITSRVASETQGVPKSSTKH